MVEGEDVIAVTAVVVTLTATVVEEDQHASIACIDAIA